MEKDSLSVIVMALLEAERTLELALSSLLPAEPATSASFDHWTLKDTLAHIAAWKQSTAGHLLNQSAGNDLPVEEDRETINHTIYSTCKNYSWDELQLFLHTAHKQMQQVIHTAGEEGLHRSGLSTAPVWTDLIGAGVWHPLYHLSGWLFEQGQRKQALELLEDFNRRLFPLPPEPRVHALAAYDCAVLMLKDGAREKAIARLRVAFSLSSRLKEWARQDPDLESLHSNAVLD